MEILKNNGTTLYVENNDYLYSTVTDIDVDENADCVYLGCEDTFNLKIELKDSAKTFPQVKKIIIEECLSIEINNSMFPNVEYVDSYNASFYSSNVLIVASGYDTLLNTFCRKEGELIDLNHCITIEEGAFDGCMSTNIVNTGFINSIHQNAFKNSAILDKADKSKPFVIINDILIHVNDGFEEAELDESISIIADDCDLNKLKRLIIHDARMVKNMTSWPEEELVIIDNYFDFDAKTYEFINCKCKITLKNTRGYFSENGVTYTNDMSNLVFCANLKQKQFKIPDGVKKIKGNAFVNCEFDELILPDSITSIGMRGFFHCNIKKIRFSKNLREIDSFRFWDCNFEEPVIIPGTIQVIEGFAFKESSMPEIILEEGVVKLKKDAFSSVNVTSKKVTLPKTLTKLEKFSLSEFRDVEVPYNNVSCLISAILSHNSVDYNLNNVTHIHINDKDFYIPHIYLLDYEKTNLLSKKIRSRKTNPKDFFEFYKNEIEDVRLKRIILLELYMKTKDATLGKYLKMCGIKLLANLLELNIEESVFIDVLKLEIFSKNALMKSLEIANNQNKIIISSYIMTMLQKKEKTDSFKL